jgi:plasmid stabilization system protein ParE
MNIKWSKNAVQQLLEAIRYIEENGFNSYAEELEKDILFKVRNIPQNPEIYPLDKYKKNNNGNYHAFEIDSYRISYKTEKEAIKV